MCTIDNAFRRQTLNLVKANVSIIVCLRLCLSNGYFPEVLDLFHTDFGFNVVGVLEMRGKLDIIIAQRYISSEMLVGGLDGNK